MKTRLIKLRIVESIFDDVDGTYDITFDGCTTQELIKALSEILHSLKTGEGIYMDIEGTNK